jgi:KipI family sensor histidine kinase inhibitor
VPDRGSDAPAVTTIGDDLLCVRSDDPAMAQHLAAHLRATGSWPEVVAGIDSVVVQFDNAQLSAAEAGAAVAAALADAPERAEIAAAMVDIPVCYGGDMGPDLLSVCTRLGMSPAEFVELHSSREYRVDMLGFTPGFAYLGGLDERLNVPRLAEPRLRVEAGSVGIAGGRTGLYALPGHGGWSIVGRTPCRLFDAAADEPFLLAPGTRIRFRAIDAAGFAAGERSP